MSSPATEPVIRNIAMAADAHASGDILGAGFTSRWAWARGLIENPLGLVA